MPGLAHFPLADEVSALFEFYGAVAEDNGASPCACRAGPTWQATG